MKTKLVRRISLWSAALLLPLTLGLGAALLRGESASAAEAELVPLAGAALRAKKSYVTVPAGGGGVWWDASQMRLYFDVKGASPAKVIQGDQKIYNDTELIEITSGGETKTVKEWADANGAGKIQWVDNMEGAVNPSDAYEIWICSQQKAWIEGITEVHLKEGFFRKTEKSSASGPALSHDYYLWNNGKDGWETSAASLTVTYKGGNTPIDYAGSVKAEDFTVTATAKDGVTEIGTLDPSKYTVQYDSNTNAGEMTVTVKYQNATGTAKVKVNPLEKQLESITLSESEATLPRFGTFEDLGVEVTANYVATEGGAKTSEKLPPEKLTVTGLDAWQEEGEELAVQVSYTYGGETKSAELAVTVGEPDLTSSVEVSVLAGETLYQPDHLALYFDFSALEKEPARVNIFQCDLTEGGHMVDYILIRSGGQEKSVREWKAAGKIDWMGISEDSKYAQHLLLINGQDTSFFSAIDKVTVKAGFQWQELIDPSKGSSWGQDRHENYRNLEGAVVKEDAPLWRAEKWQKYATELTATYEESEVTEGDALDPLKLTVRATFFDGTRLLVTNDAIFPEVFGEVGDGQEIEVRYQDRTATFTVDVKKAEKYPSSLTLEKSTLTVSRYDALDLSSAKATVAYDNGTTEQITLADCSFEPIDSYQKGTFTREVSFTRFNRTVTATLTVEVTDADTTKGLVLITDNGKPTADGDSTTQHLFYFDFKGIPVPDYYNLFGIENFVGGHVAQFIEITSGGVTKTAAAWKQEGKIAWISVIGGTEGGYQLRYCIEQGSGASDDPTRVANTAWLNAVTTVTFKAGFAWVVAEDRADHFPTGAYNLYRERAGAALKQDITVWNAGAKGWQKYAQDIDVSTTQTELYLDDILDLTKLTLKAKYSDGTEKTIPVTADMLTYSFESGGSNTVQLKYHGHTAHIDVTVVEKRVVGIVVSTSPSKTSYAFGASKVDLTGAVVNKRVKDITSNEETLEPIPLSLLTVENFDGSSIGACTVTLKYANFTTTFQVQIEELEEGQGVTVLWENASVMDPRKQVSGVTVTFGSAGQMFREPKANQLTGNEENVIDKVEINGKPASEYMVKDESGTAPIDWIGFFAWEFTIALKDSRLVWSTWADGGATDGTNNPACVYVEGVSEVIHTIKLKKGFQIYTSADNQDHWGKADGYSDFVKLEGAVLSHDIYLYNDDGYSWERILKQKETADPDKGILDPADDALVIESLPEKTVFEKGENFRAAGLAIRATYADGESELLTSFSNSDFKGYRKDQVGKQTITFSRSGKEVTFEVEVVDSSAPGESGGATEEEGCGGCGSSLGTGAFVGAIALLAGCFVAVFAVKRKEK